MLFANLLAGRHLACYEFLSDDSLYFAQFAFLAQVDDGDGSTCFTGTSRTSASVGIALRIIRQTVVYNMRQVVHIQSAGSHIGSYQQLQMALAELLHHQVALCLGKLSVKRIGVVSVLNQFVGNLLCFLTGAAEDDSVNLRIVIGNAFQCQVFIFGVYHIEHMVHVFASLVFGTYNNLFGIMQILFRDARNLRTHGGGEEQRIAVFRHIGQNGVDTVGKSHVQHLVGLIHYHILHGGKAHGAALHQVD